MKRVYLLRHGKSDWDADYGRDHERPLADRGVRAARRMGRFLSAVGQEPELIVSSSAVRALSTAQLAHESGGWNCELTIEPGLYGAGTGGVVDVLQQVDDQHDSVLLTGHEPTFSAITGALIGSGTVRFPTAALARVDLNVSRWAAADFGRGALIFFVTPKLLGKAGLGD